MLPRTLHYCISTNSSQKVLILEYLLLLEGVDWNFLLLVGVLFPLKHAEAASSFSVDRQNHGRCEGSELLTDIL